MKPKKPHMWVDGRRPTSTPVYPDDIGREKYKRLTMFNRPLRRLDAPVSYWWGDQVITVHPGFLTDFSSIPRIPMLWRVVGRYGLHDAAGVIHDALCRFGKYSEKEADLIWMWCSIDNGMPPWRARLAHRLGLRLAAPFRRHGYEANGDSSLLVIKKV